MKISVLIRTFNEEDRIEKCLQSVKDFANEIVIIDSGSTDKTIEKAESFGARVIYNKWEGFGKQRIFGSQMCNNDWILDIDADQEVPKELKNEITKRWNNGDFQQYSAFKLKLKGYFWFEKKPHLLAKHNKVVLLYNRRFCNIADSAIYDEVTIKEGHCGLMRYPLYECSMRSMHHWIEKINNYTTSQAKEACKKGKKVSIYIIPFIYIAGFLKCYFIRNFWVYGIRGIIFSQIYAFSRMLKYIKIFYEYKQR